MSLTLRTNGSSGVNLVTASWWNDYLNLLTGVMTDQIVTLKTDLTLQSTLSGSVGAPTLTLAAGTTLGIGAYQYIVTFVDTNNGETSFGNATVASITTTTSNQKVSLTAIPTGPTGTVKRNIYRTKVGGTTYFLLATISDNVTTTYSDTIADASLPTTQAPGHPSFGGTLIVKNSSGTVKGQVYSDGAISFDGGNLTTDGSGNLMVAGGLSFGSAVSGNYALMTYYSPISAVLMRSPQSGVANGFVFTTWGGSSGAVPFSIGGQLQGAYAYIDNSGNFLTSAAVKAGSFNWGPSWQGFLDYSTGNHESEMWAPQSGVANGHLFLTWNGSAQVSALSIGATGVGGQASIDNSGNFIASGTIYSNQYFRANIPVIGNAWWNALQVVPGGAATVNHTWYLTYDGSTGNTFLQDASTGDIPWSAHTDGSFWFGTYRNGGVSTQVPIYTGTSTPGGSPPTGSIWVKA